MQVSDQEIENGFDFRGVEVVGEELGTKKGEAGEVLVMDALGLEEVNGGKELVDSLRGWEFVRLSIRVYNAYGFEVANVFTVRSAEFDVKGSRGFGC